MGEVTATFGRVSIDGEIIFYGDTTDHAPPPPSQHYKFVVKSNPKASLMFALFKKKEKADITRVRRAWVSVF